jgi:hypothetical protein
MMTVDQELSAQQKQILAQTMLLHSNGKLQIEVLFGA